MTLESISWETACLFRSESGERFLVESEIIPEGEFVPCAHCGYEINHGLRLTVLKGDGRWLDRLDKRNPVPVFCTLRCASSVAQDWLEESSKF